MRALRFELKGKHVSISIYRYKSSTNCGYDEISFIFHGLRYALLTKKERITAFKFTFDMMMRHIFPLRRAIFMSAEETQTLFWELMSINKRKFNYMAVTPSNEKPYTKKVKLGVLLPYTIMKGKTTSISEVCSRLKMYSTISNVTVTSGW